MNWRMLIGLVFLIGGILRLYYLYASKVTGNPIYVEIGCGVWIFVGLLLIIKGMTEKPQ